MNKLKFLFHISLALACSAYAEQNMYPRTGVIASSTEIASLKYSCSKPKDDKINYRIIECDFYYQTLKKGEFINQRTLIADEFRKSDIPEEICVISGKKNIKNMTVAEVQAELDSQHKTQNKFTKELIAEITPILHNMCKEKTLDSFFKLVEIQANIKANTCEIETGKTKETFTELPQKKGERSLWISEQNSMPPCGRKDIIKFIPIDKERWHIQYEHIVLNKQAKNDDGKSCKLLDGVRNIFNSTANTWNTPCKHIKLANKGAWNGPFNPK